MDEDALDRIIAALRNRLGRIPTEDEVLVFIQGSDWDRLVIWNSAKKETQHGIQYRRQST